MLPPPQLLFAEGERQHRWTASRLEGSSLRDWSQAGVLELDMQQFRSRSSSWSSTRTRHRRSRVTSGSSSSSSSAAVMVATRSRKSRSSRAPEQWGDLVRVGVWVRVSVPARGHVRPSTWSRPELRGWAWMGKRGGSRKGWVHATRRLSAWQCGGLWTRQHGQLGPPEQRFVMRRHLPRVAATVTLET